MYCHGALAVGCPTLFSVVEAAFAACLQRMQASVFHVIEDCLD